MSEWIKIPQGWNFWTKLSLSATSPNKHRSVFEIDEKSDKVISTPWAKVNLFHLKDLILKKNGRVKEKVELVWEMYFYEGNKNFKIAL